MAQNVLTVNAQGRVVIPSELRRELGITPGSTLVVYVERGRLVFEDRAHLLARIQDEVAAHVPAGVSLAAELHADRRREAVLEAVEGSPGDRARQQLAERQEASREQEAELEAGPDTPGGAVETVTVVGRDPVERGPVERGPVVETVTVVRDSMIDPLMHLQVPGRAGWHAGADRR